MGSLEQVEDFPVTFETIKGQESVKRALEIACAGGHNVLVNGDMGPDEVQKFCALDEAGIVAQCRGADEPERAGQSPGIEAGVHDCGFGGRGAHPPP